jgi:hypothetical protein
MAKAGRLVHYRIGSTSTSADNSLHGVMALFGVDCFSILKKVVELQAVAG